MIQTERVDRYRTNPSRKVTKMCAFTLGGYRPADEPFLILPHKNKGNWGMTKTPKG